MIDKGVLLRLLDHKKIAILKVLYFAKENMYLREIAKKSGVPLSSVFRILQSLENLNLVRTSEIGMMKFYGLVRNEKSAFLDSWFKEENPLNLFVEAIRNINGIKKAMLHGGVEKNHANVILLGSGIDESQIDAICNKTKEAGLDLSHIILTESQFEKLDKMGVYAGEKKILL